MVVAVSATALLSLSLHTHTHTHTLPLHLLLSPEDHMRTQRLLQVLYLLAYGICDHPYTFVTLFLYRGCWVDSDSANLCISAPIFA